MRKLLNDCRYCDNKGSNCVRHKDVPPPRTFMGLDQFINPGRFVKDWTREGETVAYTSVASSLVSARILEEENEDE